MRHNMVTPTNKRIDSAKAWREQDITCSIACSAHNDDDCYYYHHHYHYYNGGPGTCWHSCDFHLKDQVVAREPPPQKPGW